MTLDPREQALQQQALAADPRASAIVSANAGSGKTHVLINRVTRILLDGVSPEQILCVTYTKAAASEMLNRLFAHLGRFSILADDELRKELVKLDPKFSPEAEDLAKARRLFARALETPGGLKIRTIHGFCEALLRQFPIEAGISAGFQIIEETESRKLQQQIIQQIGLHAVENPDGDLASAYNFLTGFGSSIVPQVFDTATAKARVLQSDFEQYGGLSGLLAQSAKILGVKTGDTKDKICQQAMENFNANRLQEIANGLSAGAAKNQQAAQDLTALQNITDPAEQLNILTGIFFTTTMTPKKNFVSKDAIKAMPELPDICGRITDEIEELLSKIYAVQSFEKTKAALTLCHKFVYKYAKAKREAGLVDFDDLIEYTRELLTDKLSTDWVLYKLDGNLRHVLVDEAQDNSPAQWAVIGALTDEFFAGAGATDETRTMFAVGDPKQSIYRFQGADPSLFVEQRNRLLQRKSDGFGKIHIPQLALSWRSTPQVLEFVDACFFGVELETKFVGEPENFKADPGFSEYLKHGAERSNSTGTVKLLSAIPYTKDETDSDPSRPVNSISSRHPVSILAQNIAKNIKSMLDRDKQINEKIDGIEIKRAVNAGDILILVRSRNSLFREIIRHLKLQGVPVAGADRMILQTETAILDLLSLAKAALQPADDLSLAEVLTGPFVQSQQISKSPITTEMLFKLANARTEGRTLHAALTDSEEPAFASAKKWFADLIERASYETPYRFFSGLLYRLTETGEPMVNRLFARLGSEVADPLQEFLSLALAFSQKGDGSLMSFVMQMAAREDEIKREMQGVNDKVRVMTIHGAKGLEAPIVFLPDTNSKPGGRKTTGLVRDNQAWLWVSSKQVCDVVQKLKDRQEILDIQEHRRLLYVALTRARDHLIICAHHKGGITGGLEDGCWYLQCVSAFEHLFVAEAATRTEDEEGGISYQLGTGASCIETQLNAAPDTMVDLPDWLDKPWQDQQNTLTTITPSGLHKGASEQVLATSPVGQRAEKRFLRGNIIHSLLQILPDLPKPDHIAAVDKFLNQYKDLTSAQRIEIAKVTLNVLNHGDFGYLFGTNSRAELPISGTLTSTSGDYLVNGKIDRLVVRDTEVLVLDFKTNRPPPKHLEDVSDVYLAQMATYRDLLQQIWPNKNIRCALLWTDGPSLMELPDNLLQSQ
ncbi:MAG: double-strand break repair helicase AddA [Robiginitomaculum sp.]|nr:double-strand break repair helicase AddA [Robiginitomaculum sp.]